MACAVILLARKRLLLALFRRSMRNSVGACTLCVL